MEVCVLPYIIRTVALLKGASVETFLKFLAHGSTHLKLHGVNSWIIHLHTEKKIKVNRPFLPLKRLCDCAQCVKRSSFSSIWSSSKAWWQLYGDRSQGGSL